MLQEFVRRKWRVHVLIAFSGAEAFRVAAECREAGAEAEIAPEGIGYGSQSSGGGPHPQESAHSPSASSRKGHLLRLLRYASRTSRLGRLRSIPAIVASSRRRITFVAGRITQLAPDCVFHGPYHSIGQVDNAISFVCRKRNIPTFCVANSPFVGEKIMRVARLNHLQTGMTFLDICDDFDWINRLFARLNPSWTRVLANGKRVFFWDPIQIWGANLAGLPMHPMWMKPSVDYQRVFLHSEFSRTLLVGDGYPAEKIVVSGPPLLDSAWEMLDDPEHRMEIYAELGLPDGEPFILYNVEPSAEHNYETWENHWQKFHDALGAVVGCGLPVVLSLHPLCQFETYAFAEKQYGVKICTTRRIHHLYPYCAISVSFPCSTNLLAEIFRKPLVIYDYFDLTQRDPETISINLLPGSVAATSGVEIKAHIERIKNEFDNKPRPAVIPKKMACQIIYEAVGSSIDSAKRSTCRSLKRESLVGNPS